MNSKIRKRQIEQIVKWAQSPTDRNLPKILESAINSRPDVGVYQPFETPLAVLPAWGKKGIRHLWSFIYPWSAKSDFALTVLLSVALKRLPPIYMTNWFSATAAQTVNYTINEEMASYALSQLRKLGQIQLRNTYIRANLLTFQNIRVIGSSKDPRMRDQLELLNRELNEAAMPLNQILLDRFSFILNGRPQLEEVLHQFLKRYPILLDPLALEVHSKHPLGSDFKTDFVLRRLNNEYVIVELERSNMTLFNRKGDKTADLNHAIGQVENQKRWVEENDYSRKKLPGIRNASGLVVIGRNHDLSVENRKALDYYNSSNPRSIKVVTYDDLFDQAKIVYQNVVSQRNGRLSVNSNLSRY